MSIVRVGTTKKYSDNWDNIFGGGSSRTAGKKKSAKQVAPARTSAKKKPAKKKAAKRPARKK